MKRRQMLEAISSSSLRNAPWEQHKPHGLVSTQQQWGSSFLKPQDTRLLSDTGRSHSTATTVRHTSDICDVIALCRYQEKCQSPRLRVREASIKEPDLSKPTQDDREFSPEQMTPASSWCPQLWDSQPPWGQFHR